MLTAALAAILAALLVSCGAQDPSRDGSGTITTAGDTRLLNLRAGDCIGNLRKSLDNPDGGANGVPLVRAVPCSQDHDAEILLFAPIGDGEEWPGYLVVSGAAASGRPELQRRLLAADVDPVKLFSFTPTENRWNFEDQKEIVYVALFEQPRAGALKAFSGGA